MRTSPSAIGKGELVARAAWRSAEHGAGEIVLADGRGRQIQFREQPRERVVARNAVLQRHVHARAPAREHRQQRDHQHLVQVVALGVASPGVVNVLNR